MSDESFESRFCTHAFQYKVSSVTRDVCRADAITCRARLVECAPVGIRPMIIELSNLEDGAFVRGLSNAVCGDVLGGTLVTSRQSIDERRHTIAQRVANIPADKLSLLEDFIRRNGA